MYLPNSPHHLLGRDLLEQLGAEIKFESGKMKFKVKMDSLIEVLIVALITTQGNTGIPEEVTNQVYPGVWATETPGCTKNASPVVIQIKQGTSPPQIKQYHLKAEDREGIQPVIDRFLKHGLLVECESKYNTLILPVKKPDGSYRIVQDLRAINKITEDLYPLVANPYTLLTKLSSELAWFTMLDLKDAFFCLPLCPESQLLFAFEWENPKSGRRTQLT